MKIKICGLTRSCDIDFVNEAGADYTGFVFAESRRRITAKQAEILKNKLNASVKSVGVFVNDDINFINGLAKDNIIDIVQLHGNETDDYIKNICAPVIKTVRIGEDYNRRCDYILFDNDKAGSGITFDWSVLPKTDKPFFLAGGINFDNINEAVKLNPYCIDVSSGVETDGYKDKNKIFEIVRRVHNE